MESPKGLQKFWWLWLIPIFAITGVAQMTPLMDPDLWWHIQTGKWIFDNHSIPSINLFSHTQPDQPWFVFEWLSQLSFYLSYKFFSWEGIYALRLVLIWGTWGLWFYLCYKFLKDPVAAALLILIAFLFMRFRIGERPEQFSYLFIAIFSSWLLLRKPKTLLEFLPLALLQVIWTNYHGYFFIGPALCFWWFFRISLVGESSRKMLIQRLIGCLLVSGSVLINPHGFELITFLIDHKNTVLLQYIGEFQPAGPLDFHPNVFGFYCYMALALVLSSLRVFKYLKMSPEERPPGSLERNLGAFGLDCILVGLGLKMGFEHVRFIWLLLMLSIPVALLNFETFKGVPVLTQRMNWVPAVFVALFSIYAISESYPKDPEIAPDFTAYPEKALQFAKQNQLNGPMFNEYNSGGYLILFAWPKYKVFIDGRFAYTEKFFGNYFDEWANPAKYSRAIEASNLGFSINQSDTDRTNTYLKFPLDGKFQPIYFDNKFVVTTRKDLARFQSLKVVCPCQDVSYLEQYAKGNAWHLVDQEFQALGKINDGGTAIQEARWYRLTQRPKKAIATLNKNKIDRAKNRAYQYESALAYGDSGQKQKALLALQNFQKLNLEVPIISKEWLDLMVKLGKKSEALEAARKQTRENPFDIETSKWLLKNSPLPLEKKRLKGDVKTRQTNSLSFSYLRYEEAMKAKDKLGAFYQIDWAKSLDPKNARIRTLHQKLKKQLKLIFPEDLHPELVQKP